MFGEPTQTTNAYLEAQQGTPQPAYRGFLGAVYRGQVAALNPYIKPWSWRVRSIKAGWDGGTCWHETVAAVPLGLANASLQLSPESEGWKYLVVANGDTADYSAPGFDDSAWAQGQSPFAAAAGHPYSEEAGYPAISNTEWPLNTSIWVRRQFQIDTPTTFIAEIFVDNYATVWVNGVEVLPRVGTIEDPSGTTFHHQFEVPDSIQLVGENDIALLAEDYGTYSYAAFRIVSADRFGMNPAHIIYQCLTDPDWGMGYPAATIDDADFQTAADALFAEGFGLCLKWSNQTEIGEFCQIVADHAGFNIVQDRTTGLFRLVMLRGGYDIETLPVFDKSSVKVIKAQRPSLEGTINEVIVKYRDTVTQKEAATAPMQNLANIQAQGRVISQTLRFDGIPTYDLAARVQERELRARSTPMWRMSLEFLRGSASNLLPGKPFVLDLLDTEFGVKLVMRVGEIDYGSPTSGRITAECVEDVFGLPASTYLVEQTSGWQPPNTEPQPATATVFEVPYRELAQTLSTADLAALPADAGYVGAAAVRPAGTSINYALRTRIGADPFEQVGVGDFAPSCLLTAVCPLEHGPTVLQVDAGTDLEDLAVGTSAWLGEGAGAELVRIDAIGTGTITVGRGCGDTVAWEWPVGTRLWGFDNYAAADGAQYVDGELVDAKILPRTSSGELAEASAPTSQVGIASRQARPYPPAQLLVNGQQAPTQLDGLLTVTWVHRDRVLQVDQLVSQEEAGVGPEAGTTYTMRTYLNEVLDATQTGISGASAAISPSGNGVVRIEVEAIRDGLASWQAQVRTFNYTIAPLNTRVTVAADRRVTTDGNTRASIG
jgi:hypothetical protein